MLDAKTGKDGVLLQHWEKPCASRLRALQYLVLDGNDMAGSGLGVPDKVAQGLSPRAYIYTDRPAYRPGQKVALRGVVREVKDGQYANTPGAVYRLEVTDSRGRQIVARPVTLSEFGTFHESLPLDEAAPVGVYRVRVFQPGKSEFAGQFEVQSYQLEPIDLAFDLKKTVYYRGETVKADVVAQISVRRAGGRPTDRRCRLPDGRILHGTTDAEGKYHVEFPTEGFAEEQALRLVAQLPQDNVGDRREVLLAVRGVRDRPADDPRRLPRRRVVPPGVTTRDAQGEPIGADLTVACSSRSTRRAASPSARSGAKPREDRPQDRATESLALQGRRRRRGAATCVRVAGTDRFGNPVVADRALTISGKKDETKLRLLADRQSYKVGEEASVNLHSRGRRRARRCWPGRPTVSSRTSSCSCKRATTRSPGRSTGRSSPTSRSTAARMAASGSTRRGSTSGSSATCA